MLILASDSFCALKWLEQGSSYTCIDFLFFIPDWIEKVSLFLIVGAGGAHLYKTYVTH
jgi:hypothetical protein